MVPTMTSIPAKLQKLEQILTDLHAPVINLLQPGIEAPTSIEFSEIMSYEDEYEGSVTLPDSVREFYAWHNGVKENADQSDQSLAPYLVFHSLDVAKSEHGTLLDVAYEEDFEDFDRRWYPLAKHLGSNLILVDCSKKKNKADAPVRFWEDQANDVGVIHDSVETMVDFWIECYSTGVYQFVKEGYIACTDDQAEAKIALRLTPKSKWWKARLK